MATLTVQRPRCIFTMRSVLVFVDRSREKQGLRSHIPALYAKDSQLIMPILEITTNVKVPDEKVFTAALAEYGIAVLGMNRHWAVIYKYNEGLIFGGTHEPAFCMTILNVLGLPTYTNAGYSKAFFTFIEKELGIPPDRGYIVFNDPGPARLGHKGTTLDVLVKEVGPSGLSS